MTGRRPCPFDLPARFSSNDSGPFDQLHYLAGALSHDAQRIKGIGGTSTAEPELPADVLRSCVYAIGHANDALRLAVRAYRDHGASWQDVADQLSSATGEPMTGQAAQRRFGQGLR